MNAIREKTSSESSNKISSKIFVGCKITSELRIHLNNSILWKQKQTLPKKNDSDLREVHRKDQSYIGVFLSTQNPSLESLKKTKKILFEKIRKLSSELDMDLLKAIVFPQVFLK